MKRHSLMRSSLQRRRHLTPSTHTRGVEFGGPTFICGDQHSCYSSQASTPPGVGLLSPLGIHLPVGGGGDGSSSGRGPRVFSERGEHEGIQRTSLRRKSVALACAVSVDLAVTDDDSREFCLCQVTACGPIGPLTAANYLFPGHLYAFSAWL